MATAPAQGEHEHGHTDFGSGVTIQDATVWAIFLAVLVTMVAVTLAVRAAVRYCHSRRARAGSGSDPEIPPPPLVYSAANTNMAGSTECPICLDDFQDGEAIQIMPACRHGFHAACIEHWLAGGRGSSCPTCRAPASSRR